MSVKGNLLVLFLIIIFSFIGLHFSTSQIGGYDLSPLVDLQYRLYENQVIGSDFYITLPLIIVYLTEFSNQLFGLDYFSLVKINIMFTCFIYFLVRLVNTSSCIFYEINKVIILFTPLIYSNHIWHGSLSGIMSCLLFYSLYNILNKKNLNFNLNLLYFFLAVFLIFLAKQNTSVLSIFLVFFYLIFFNFPLRNKILLISTFAIGIIASISVSIFFFNIDFRTMEYIYFGISGRPLVTLTMMIEFSQMYANYFLITIMLFLMLLVFRDKGYKSLNNANIFLYGIFGIIAFLAILTNWDVKIHDLVLPLFILNVYFNGGNQHQN